MRRNGIRSINLICFLVFSGTYMITFSFHIYIVKKITYKKKTKKKLINF